MPSILQRILGKAEQKLPGKFAATATEMEIAAAKKMAMDAERRAAIQAADDRVEQRFQEYVRKHKEGIPLEQLDDNFTYSSPAAGTQVSKTTDALLDGPPPPPRMDASELAPEQKLIGHDQSSNALVKRAPEPEVLGTPNAPKSMPNMGDIAEGEIVSPQKLIEYSQKDPAFGSRMLGWLKQNPGKAITGAVLTGVLLTGGGDGSQPPIDAELDKQPASEPAPEAPVAPQKAEEPIAEKTNALSKLEAALQQPQESLTAKPEMKDYDVGEGGLPVMEGLKQAQAAEEEDLMRARYGRMGDTIGGAISGEGEQLGQFHEGLEKQAGRHVTRFKDMVAAQELDPDSPMSKMFNDYAKQMGFNIKGRMSYAQAKDLMPKLAAQFEKEQDRTFKGEENKLNRLVQLARIEEMKNAKGEAKEAKLDVRKDKFIDNAYKVLLKPAQEVQQILTAKQGIEEAIKSGQGGAPDVEILYNFIKLLDPGSVVREGEIKLSEQGMSLFGKIKAGIKNITGGDILDSRFRNQVYQMADRKVNSTVSNYKQLRNPLEKAALSRGITEDRFQEFDPMNEVVGSIPDAKEPAGSKQVNELINSRSDEENLKRLEELEKLYPSGGK